MVSCSRASVGRKIMVKKDGRCSCPWCLPTVDIMHSRRGQGGRASPVQKTRERARFLAPSHLPMNISYLDRGTTTDRPLGHFSIQHNGIPFNVVSLVPSSCCHLALSSNASFRASLASQIALVWTAGCLGSSIGTRRNGLCYSNFTTCLARVGK